MALVGMLLQDHWTQAKLAELKLTVARQDSELQAASTLRHELEAKCRQLTDTLAALTATEQSLQVAVRRSQQCYRHACIRQTFRWSHRSDVLSPNC